MKKFIKKNLQRGLFWFLTRKIFISVDKIFLYKEELHKDFMRKADKHLQQTVFKGLQVKNGVFEGLKYHDMQAFGSMLYPKLIGSYENEIEDVFKDIILKNKFGCFIDIGCAEGYYAVGMALSMSDLKVYAYDTEKSARKLCLEMATLNEVKNQINIHEYFGQNSLKDFDTANTSTFILCDCEGYEIEIFTENNILDYKNCHLLIEMHDFINPKISQHLKNIFYNTHNLKIYKSEKRQINKYKNYFDGLNLNSFEKQYILDEKRPCLMEWLYCEPKK